jgi:hypothetical protein
MKPSQLIRAANRGASNRFLIPSILVTALFSQFTAAQKQSGESHQ